MTTKTIKTILFASLIAAMILPFSTMDFAQAAPNENANENAKKYTKAQVIEEIDKRVSDLNDKLATDANNERLVDSKQSYLIGKKIIQIQLNMETASDKELDKLGEQLVKNLEKLEKLNEKYEVKITKTSVNEPNVLEELFAPQMAHAGITDSWILQQSRSECGTTYASTSGSMEGFASSSNWSTTNIYPSSIGVGSFPNCDTEYFDHSTTKFFKLGLGLCWHDISTASGSWSEDCPYIQSGDLVIVEIQGYYGSGWIKTWYKSVPMADVLWL